MNFKEILRTAARSLRINPLRAMLSIMGVIFGIASVIALISMGEGVKAQISEQVQGLGTDLLEIKSGEPISEEEGPSMAQIEQLNTPNLSSSTITMQDLQTAREDEYIEDAYPMVKLTSPVASGSGGESVTAFIFGTDSHYSKVNDLKIAYGDFLSDEEGEGDGEGTAVIGPSIAIKLFGSEDQKVVGKTVNIMNGEIRLKVVGILERRETTVLGTRNFDMFIDISDAQKAQGVSEETILSISAKVKDEDQIDTARDSLEPAIRKNHGGEQDFNIQTPQELINTYNKIFNILTALVIGVASISLIEGGIGVANIMYVSVKERTKEIGVRLAQGASKKVVILQFLLESVLLCMVGALIGIPLGILTAVIINSFTVLPATPTLGSVFVAFLAAFVVGIVAGVFPARQATRVEITDALRSD